MSLFSDNLFMGASATGGGGVTPFDPTVVGKSVWLDGLADFLTKTFASGSAQTDVVLAAWVQRNKLGTVQDIFSTLGPTATRSNRVTFEAADTVEVHLENVAGTTSVYRTSELFRDVGWYHVLVSISVGSASGQRVKLFINGVEVGVPLVSGSVITGDVACFGNSTLMNIGVHNNGFGLFRFLNAYITQPVMLVGQSIQDGDVAITDFLDAFTYGTNGSQFTPKADSDIVALASTAGGNSFCLTFSNSGSLGLDSSSNGNNFTPTSMSSVNQAGNTPSKMYATMNPLIIGDSTLTFTEGNLRVTGSSGSDGGTFSTLPMAKTGTTEFQTIWNNGDGATGIVAYDELTAVSLPSNNAAGGATTNFNASYSYDESGGLTAVIASGITTTSSFFPTLTSGDVVTVRYNADANQLNFLKNNVAVGSTIATVAGITYYAFAARLSNYDISMRFDESTFTHAIGAGNKTIDTSALAAPSFQGVDFFKPTIYTGSGATKSITNTHFKPDVVWIKNRDAVDSHALYDIVRGVNNQTEPDTTSAETIEPTGLTIFGADGFTVGSLGQVNTSTEKYVAWQWLAGNTTGSANALGTITSTVTTAAADHLSVGSYIGTGSNATVGHGLSSTPEFIITVNRSATPRDKMTYHEGMNASPGTGFIQIDARTPFTANSTVFNNTAPASTVFSIGSDNSINGSGNNHVFYAFKSVLGVCKVGSYKGNGSADGTYIDLGFKPAWIFRKNATVTNSWPMQDAARNLFNVTDTTLVSDTDNAESALGSSGKIDILSSGFKCRDTLSISNSNLVTYVYIAMADIGGNGTLPPIYGH